MGRAVIPIFYDARDVRHAPKLGDHRFDWLEELGAGPLQNAELELVHLIDDPGIGSCRRFESRPRYRLGCFPVGVEIVEELTRCHSGNELIEPPQVTSRWPWICAF